MNHVEATIQTYNRIAADYHVAATPENRAWLEASMREFFPRLPGQAVLVPGCGEGRDSRYLRDLGATVVSFDLSDGMLAQARAADPAGTYLQLDFRAAGSLAARFDGIWACACLYHLTKLEFRACLAAFRKRLNPGGILFLNLKLGSGEAWIDVPRDGYFGGEAAKQKLSGSRYFAFYQRDELNDYFAGFTVELERRNNIQEGEGAMEFFLRNPAG
ncbi:MAG TPA: class I SAM-dependent methyltransferase [Opitutaceae bacterium]|nr:class I SAM-dependent methyltransferase [Opitutaceae bacterium]